MMGESGDMFGREEAPEAELNIGLRQICETKSETES
jgi:hypothetical protein